MPGKCALELVEPEVQRQILSQVATLEQLHSLIKASPRLYHVFSLNKQHVLSAVARRQFHPTVLPEALAFAQISQLEQPCPPETARKYCDIDSSKQREWQASVSSISESLAMCKLAGHIKFFIEDYTRNTLPIMEGLSEAPDFEIFPEYRPRKAVLYSDLSTDEIGRLQRAFCRFEIYRSLFARCSPDLDHDVQECSRDTYVGPAEQASLYLEKFPDYQVAEINCIRDYLVRRLRGICLQLENEAVNTLSPDLFVFDREGDVETNQWNSGIYLFTEFGKHDQIGQMEHLMELGLPYIRKLFVSTGECRKVLFMHDPGHYVIHHLRTYDYITRAFECLDRNPAWEDAKLLAKTGTPFMYETKPDTELKIPAAWEWAHPCKPPIKLSDDCFKGLRDWGYVFWDHNRLQESGILERESHDVRRNDFDEYTVSTGPSVQEQLLKPLSIWYFGSDPVDSNFDCDGYSDVDGDSIIDDENDISNVNNTDVNGDVRGLDIGGRDSFVVDRVVNEDDSVRVDDSDVDADSVNSTDDDEIKDNLSNSHT